MSENNPITIDNSTFAGNPGNATLDRKVWFRYNKKTVILLVLFMIVSIALTFKVSGWFAILAVIAVAVNWFYWWRKKEHFSHGDSNGGLVVGVNPTLVAVYTDMSQGYGYYPIVKIEEYTNLGSVSIGDQIATVALYAQGRDDTLFHWIGFDPIPLSFATDDSETIKQAFDSYPDEQWELLADGLKQLSQPYSPGIYKMKIEGHNWDESDYEFNQ